MKSHEKMTKFLKKIVIHRQNMWFFNHYENWCLARNKWLKLIKNQSKFARCSIKPKTNRRKIL